MKLYSYPGAPSPERVALMLKYKGVELETEIVDMRSGAHMRAPYSEINPSLTLPALVTDDGSCLTEVVAICWYLDTRFPDRPVFGRNDIERALVINWMHRIFSAGFMAAAEALRNSSPNMQNRALPGPDDIPQIAELAERGMLRLGLFMEMLNRHLQERQFIVSASLTQADIDAYVILNFARWVKVIPSQDQPALLRWRQSIDALLG